MQHVLHVCEVPVSQPGEPRALLRGGSWIHCLLFFAVFVFR